MLFYFWIKSIGVFNPLLFIFQMLSTMKIPNKIRWTIAILTFLFIGCSTNTKEEETNTQEERKNIPVNSLEDVLTNLAPITKTFEINPTEESMLTGDKGTAIYIPKNAFQFADGTTPVGKVNIELKECYSLTDMIAENMNTSSGQRILETGGMIYFNATTEGKQLSVKDGKAFVIGFPKDGGTKEMGLFYDVAINDTSSTWVPDYKMYEAEALQNNQADTTSSDMVEGANVEYPIEMTDDLYDYTLSALLWTSTFWDLMLVGENRNILDFIRDPANVNGEMARELYDNGWNVYYEIKIDKNGNMTDFQIDPHPYHLDDKPANSEQACKTVLNLLKSAPAFDLSTSKDGIRQDWDYSLGVGGNRAINWDRFKAKFRGQFSAYKDKAVQQMDSTALDYYMFSATKMGWINCDRFWDIDEEEKIDFFVTTQTPKNIKVQIIFKDINSIMTGTNKEGRIVFNNVPLGRQIKVIGISYTNGKPTMGVAQTTIDKDGFELTAFNEFSLDDLEKELNRKN